MEELELADSHPLPESWAKLGARKGHSRKCVVFAPVLCHGPQALSSEILTSLHVGQPRWSVAGEAEPAEGPMRGGGLCHHRPRTHRHTQAHAHAFPWECSPATSQPPARTTPTPTFSGNLDGPGTQELACDNWRPPTREKGTTAGVLWTESEASADHSRSSASCPLREPRGGAGSN